jgi:hypothetical protein
MREFLTTCNRPLTNESFDARVGQWVCYLGGVAMVPAAAIALMRHPGERGAFFLGMGLAVLTGLLIVMLGTICRYQCRSIQGKLALRKRLFEFASYAACMGILVGGVSSLAGLGLNESEIVLCLLMISAVSLAVLTLGMLSSLVRSLER